MVACFPQDFHVKDAVTDKCDLTSFFTKECFFIPFSCLIALATPPLQWWIQVAGGHLCIWSLGKNFQSSTIKSDVSSGFFMDVFYQTGNFLHLVYWSSVWCFNHEKKVEFCQMCLSFCIYWHDNVSFVLYSTDVVLIFVSDLTFLSRMIPSGYGVQYFLCVLDSL
jgi:hypothetical protein